MDRFLDWLASSAPWLLPLLFVLSLTFLIVPVAARNGYNDLIGEAPQFAELFTPEPAPGKSGKPEPQVRPVARSDFSELEPEPRLGLWAEVLAASISSKPPETLVSLLVIVLALAAVAMNAGGLSPFLIPAKYLPLAFGQGALLFVVILVLSTWGAYTAPLQLHSLGEGHIALSEGLEHTADSDFATLYSSLHGVDAGLGRSEKDPDWSLAQAATAHFRRLCQYTFRSLAFLVLLSVLAAAALRLGGRLNPTHPGAVVATLLVALVLCCHAVQWFWLAESYGRLEIGRRELLQRGQVWSHVDPSIEKAEGPKHWPFLRSEIEKLPPQGTSCAFQMRHPWPLPPGGLGVSGEEELPAPIELAKRELQLLPGGAYLALLSADRCKDKQELALYVTDGQLKSQDGEFLCDCQLDPNRNTE